MWWCGVHDCFLFSSRFALRDNAGITEAAISARQRHHDQAGAPAAAASVAPLGETQRRRSLGRTAILLPTPARPSYGSAPRSVPQKSRHVAR